MGLWYQLYLEKAINKSSWIYSGQAKVEENVCHIEIEFYRAFKISRKEQILLRKCLFPKTICQKWIQTAVETRKEMI